LERFVRKFGIHPMDYFRGGYTAADLANRAGSCGASTFNYLGGVGRRTGRARSLRE
jgi:hypothetical protein